jgi:arylformamidase
MKETRWIDLSRTISSETPVYPGDPQVVMKSGPSVDKEGFNLTTLTTGMHVGTHLDAPLHFIKDGADASEIPLSKVIGFANRIRVAPKDGILTTTAIEKAYEAIFEKTDKLLIDCGWQKEEGKPEFFTAFPGFEPDLAHFLKGKKIVLLGTDMPSVKYGTSDQKGAHLSLLHEKIVIVESLINLGKLEETFFLSCLPIKLQGMDGSVIRAVASKTKNDGI